MLVDFDGLCSADMYPIDSKIDGSYLHRWLLTEEFTEAASRQQGRTVLPKINQKALQTMAVPVPPINEQRRIVAKINALSERSLRAKQSLDAIPPLLDKLRKSVLASAFRGDLTREWRAQHPGVEPASLLLERIRQERRQRWEQAELEKMRAKGKEPKDDKWKAKYKEPEPVDTDGLPELPEGWCWAALEEVVQPGVDIVYGIVQPGKEVPDGVPYVRGKDIQDGVILEAQLRRTSPEIAKKYARAALAGGDVLLGIIRATKVAVVPGSLSGGNITQGTVRIRPGSCVTSRYLAGALEDPNAQARLHAMYRGIDMPGLNVRDVRRLAIPLAPALEQEEVSKAATAALASVHRVVSSSTRLLELQSQLEQSVLARAFCGQLVAQDPNDESAEAMLDRTRLEAEACAPAKKRATKRSRKQAG